MDGLNYTNMINKVINSECYCSFVLSYLKLILSTLSIVGLFCY